MNFIVPTAALAALLIISNKQTMQQMQRISVAGAKIGTVKVSLTETVFPLTLSVYNPNSSELHFNYFQGFVSRNGTRIGEFTFNSDGKSIALASRGTTPMTFNVRITTLGVVRSLFSLFKNFTTSTSLSAVFDVDGIYNAGGFDIPVKFSYDVKKNSFVNNSNTVAGIGLTDKEYYDYEFGHAIKLFQRWNTQRLGTDSKEQAAELTKLLKNDAEWLIEKVEWVAEGNYGAGNYFIIKNWYKNLAATDKRREQGLRSIAINSFILMCSCEFSDLNAKKVVDVVKKAFSKPEMELFNKKIVTAIEEKALADHWIMKTY